MAAVRFFEKRRVQTPPALMLMFTETLRPLHGKEVNKTVPASSRPLLTERPRVHKCLTKSALRRLSYRRRLRSIRNVNDAAPGSENTLGIPSLRTSGTRMLEEINTPQRALQVSTRSLRTVGSSDANSVASLIRDVGPVGGNIFSSSRASDVPLIGQ